VLSEELRGSDCLRRQWSLRGSGCQVLSKELGEGSNRSEETVVVKCLVKSSAEAVIAQRQ
jgi:hypothetical protein